MHARTRYIIALLSIEQKQEQRISTVGYGIFYDCSNFKYTSTQIIKNQIDFICFGYIQRNWTWNDVNYLEKWGNSSNFFSFFSLSHDTCTWLAFIVGVYEFSISMKLSMCLLEQKQKHPVQKAMTKTQFSMMSFQCCTCKEKNNTKDREKNECSFFSVCRPLCHRNT